MQQEKKNPFMDEICRIIDLLSPSMDDYLYILDFVNDFYYISPEAAKRFCMPSHAFYNASENIRQFVYPGDYAKLQEDLQGLLETDRNVHNIIYRWLSVEGQPIWINCRGQVVRRDGEAQYLIGCVNEIGTGQKADNVSGLLGDSSFQIFLSDYEAEPPKGYFLRLGLDDLKGLNARLGVEYGNQILRRTAELIAGCIKPEQKLYRIIGDEYLVVDFSGGEVEEAQELYQQIRLRLEQYIDESNYEAVFTLSGGAVACSDLRNFSYSDVMRLTEFALDTAKFQGRNRCYQFCREDYDHFLKRRSLMLKLRQAVNRGIEGFEVYYQPIYRADNGKIYGAEALIRFHSEEYGMVSPAEFVPILEDTGLIIPVGRWILHQAMETCREFQKIVPDFHVNINLSNVQVMKSDVCGDILAGIQEYGLKPGSVTIELTESGSLETDNRFISMWSRLKEAGVLLALDDFGTGYSNFRYITELKPDIIKIDRTFTVKVMENEFEYALLSLFTDMAHNLNLKICVEGIETEEERQKLYQLAPDCFQGFYFGRPCPKEQFRGLLL